MRHQSRPDPLRQSDRQRVKIRRSASSCRSAGRRDRHELLPLRPRRPLDRWSTSASASPTTRLPGVDIVLPDPRFIEEQRAKLDGLILTHAHEDHLGAVPYLWPRLRLPDLVHALHRRRAAARSWREADFAARRADHASSSRASRSSVGGLRLPLRPRHPLDPRCQRAGARHAASARVLHTGDWKLDPAPLVGARTDVDGAGAAGQGGRAGDGVRQHQRALAAARRAPRPRCATA